jgi:pyruvate formate lyase activating enzyme
VGTVFNIQRYSIHDGPGVRTTVFLKGCPLSCLWCHNPEGMSLRPEVIFRQNRCTLCGDCLGICPRNALSSRGSLISIDDELCDRCGHCEEACPAGALEVAGKEMTVEQVIAEVERDTIFYDQSGGGVTFSGGEPLSQPDFLRQLLEACREREISTALDTTGYASAEVIRSVAGLVELFLFDVKLADAQRHRMLTGVENGPILKNLRALALSGHNITVRTPIIPGVNDDDENVLAIGEIAGSLCSGQRINILPYHNIAEEKYRRLRRPYRLPDIQPPSQERMSQIAATLEGFGLVVTVGG